MAQSEAHLSKLDPSDANDAMISRLRENVNSGMHLHVSELDFLKHEEVERRLMEAGLDYERAHRIASEFHPAYANYHPDVIRQLRTHFNNGWREYWGIE